MAGLIQNKNEVAKATGKKTLQQYIQQMQGEIKKALPSVMTPERFTRITLSALSSNPKLGECTPASFLGAMMTAAQLGLEVNTPLGLAYLIPYRNHGVMECQFQLGYRGLLDLAYRSGNVKSIQSKVIYSNDEFVCSYGLEPQLKLIPAMLGDRGEPIGVAAMFTTKDGGYGFDVMSMDEVRRHAKKYSKAYNSGPWQTNFEEMALKTVIKKTLKYAPLSSEFVRLIGADETIKTELSDDMFSVPDTMEVDYTVNDAEDAPEVDETTGEVKEG